jgi:hypothetical protein
MKSVRETQNWFILRSLNALTNETLVLLLGLQKDRRGLLSHGLVSVHGTVQADDGRYIPVGTPYLLATPDALDLCSGKTEAVHPAMTADATTLHLCKQISSDLIKDPSW